MATFEAQTMVDPSPGVNALYNAQQGQWIQNQRNQLAAAASQQDLADRATLRGLAPGLAANDPTAYAGAAVLPGGPNAVTALTGTGDLALRQQELAFKLAQIRGANQALDSVYPGQGGTAATPGQGGPSGTFEHQLGAYEAPGGPGSENKGGYIGQFQFGASRLADLGMYAPAPGEDVSKNQWSGTFDIPGFPDVKTKADFLASPAAQHAAFQSHVGSIDTAIAQTPGADKLDPNGLRAVAHLGGLDGMRKFVASGGTYDPADSNGTHLSDYYQRFAAAGAPGLQAVFGSPHGPGGPPAATTATAAPVVPGGVAARTGGTNVAGPGAGPLVVPPGSSPLLVPGSSRVAPTLPVAGGPVAQNTLVPPAPAQPVVAPPPAPTAQPAPAQPAPQQPGGVGPNTPQGFKPGRDDAAQPQAPVTDAQGLTAADHDVLARMKQGFKLTMDPAGAAKLQEEIDKRQATNRALSVAAWNAANPNIRATPQPGQDENGNPGTYMVQGNRIVGFIPAQTQPPQGPYENMKTAYERDSKNIGDIAAEGRAAQGDQVRVQEMRNLLQNTNTGSGSETQAAIQGFLQRWAPQALTNWTTNYANLDGPAAIQMFQKLGFMGATSQEQQTTPRGGYLATKLFQQFNPGAQLLTATNQGLLAQRLISNQAGIDYSQGALDHFAQQEGNFTSPKPSYSSLLQYDRRWQSQRNPQVYAASIGALGQQDYNQWSKGLSDDEIQRSIDVVRRADPNAVINGKGGRLNLGQPLSGGPAQSQTNAPTVGTVQQGYRFKGGDPSNQANWDRVQ
jgi:hypothetical protein